MFDLKTIILEQTQYISGYANENDDYVISASMIGKEDMQNYLSIVHGKIADTEINDATLGSIFHKGLEVMVIEANAENTYNLRTEHSMNMELPNGWILSGTADLIAERHDGITGIHDYKLTKSYKLKMMLKNLAEDEYTHQLQTLDMLFRNEYPHVDTELVCDLFIKDAKAVNYESTHNPVVVPKALGKVINDGDGGTMTISADQELIAKIVVQTNRLQGFIESGEVPAECSDKWIRNVKGNTIPTKCAFYCAHGKAGLCPYYNPTTRQSVNRLVNW